MALVSEVGMSPEASLWPRVPSGAPALLASVINDTAEKFAWVGTVWHPTVKSGNIAIRKVHFLLGTVTFNVLSTLRISLQDVSATAGPPYQPDGTQDQTYDFAGSGLSTDAWTTTGNLSADRTQAVGGFLAVVAEFQTFTALDSVEFRSLDQNCAVQWTGLGGRALLNTGSYAAVASSVGIVMLECDDGSFAFLSPNLALSALGNVSVANNVTARAAGAYFRVPTTRKVDTLWLAGAFPNGCDGSLILYDSDGTTALATITVDNDAVLNTSGTGLYVKIPDITLTAATWYRLAYVPGTTTAAAIYYMDVAAAGHLYGMPMGPDCHWTQRDSGGAWAETATRRPWVGFGWSAFDDGAGGGGRISGAGLHGGFNA